VGVIIRNTGAPLIGVIVIHHTKVLTLCCCGRSMDRAKNGTGTSPPREKYRSWLVFLQCVVENNQPTREPNISMKSAIKNPHQDLVRAENCSIKVLI